MWNQQPSLSNCSIPPDSMAVESGGIERALADSGFGPQGVAYYGVDELFSGPRLIIITVDGHYREATV